MHVSFAFIFDALLLESWNRHNEQCLIALFCCLGVRFWIMYRSNCYLVVSCSFSGIFRVNMWHLHLGLNVLRPSSVSTPLARVPSLRINVIFQLQVHDVHSIVTFEIQIENKSLGTLLWSKPCFEFVHAKKSNFTSIPQIPDYLSNTFFASI